VTVTLVKADTSFVAWPVFKPIVRCGQQSLYIFCAGIVLSFTGHWLLVEVDAELLMQILVSAGGIAVMIGLAYLIGWYRRADAAAAASRAGRAQIAGGE